MFDIVIYIYLSVIRGQTGEEWWRGRDGSAEDLNRETGEKQTTVGWTRRKDGG